MPKKKTEKTEKKPAKTLSAAELEKKVLELVKKDTPLAKAGLQIKKEYGVTPKTVLKLGKILEKAGLINKRII